MLSDLAALNMPANLENSAVATGLEKVSFHPNTKERQCQKVQTIAHLHSSHPHVAQLVKNSPAMRETWVRSLGWEYPLEKGKATHSNILAWKIP